jgi:putative ABC transport system substrate-binding protein
MLAAMAISPPGVVSSRPPARIGWLTTGPHPFLQDFGRRLRELGYVEGRTVVIEERYAGDRHERLRELATDLVQDKVDVIVVSGALATAWRAAW